MTPCFSTSYLPCISWMKEALRSESIQIESKESWQKQSYRNRSYILSPQGKMMLNIPVDHSSTAGPIDEVRISYAENWQHRHWQSIISCYGTAPFFEPLISELEPFYSKNWEYLLDFNSELLHLIFNWLQVQPQMALTTEWHSDLEADFREKFHPKKPLENHKSYPQVFSSSLGFTPDLSVIDLIFNEGRAAYDYLVA